MNGSVLCLVGLLQLFTVHPVLALQAHPAHAPHWHHPSRQSGRRIQCGGRGSRNNMSTHKPSIKPNAFVSIRISSPEIRANMERVQQEMQHRDRRLRSTMVSLDKLHLTLMVLRLDNSEEEKRAKELLCNVTKLISGMYSFDKKLMKIDVQGIGSFSKRVVFANVAPAECLADIADVVRSEFGKGGLPTTDSKRFNAHLTIAKTSKSYVRSIPSSSYSHLHDINFGVDSFDGLELLSMSRPEDRDGYYYCFKKCSF